jgi:hypothetical protein
MVSTYPIRRPLNADGFERISNRAMALLSLKTDMDVETKSLNSFSRSPLLHIQVPSDMTWKGQSDLEIEGA